MQTYWAQDFLLPKKILYYGYQHMQKLATMITQESPWQLGDRLCQPRSTGGLNMLNFFLWNKAAIYKLLWAVANKKDKLQVRWIHDFNIKGRGLSNMDSPKQETWLVRKIFDSRSQLTAGISILESLIVSLSTITLA